MLSTDRKIQVSGEANTTLIEEQRQRATMGLKPITETNYPIGLKWCNDKYYIGIDPFDINEKDGKNND